MKVKVIDYGGKIPTRAHYNDAGADVYSLRDYVLWPGQNITVPLGFGVELPDGCCGFIFPRTSLSSKGITCDLPPIDSGYTGEVHAFMRNTSSETYHIKAGDKIGQLVLIPAVIADFVTDLGAMREAGAFGSSGR